MSHEFNNRVPSTKKIYYEANDARKLTKHYLNQSQIQVWYFWDSTDPHHGQNWLYAKNTIGLFQNLQEFHTHKKNPKKYVYSIKFGSWSPGTPGNPGILSLTLSRAAPSAIAKGRGGGSLTPPQVWRGCWGLWFQILVITSYLTQIDTRQKDLQLSDT